MKTLRLLPAFWLVAWFTSSAICFFFVSTDHVLEHSFAPASILSPLGADAFGRDLLSLGLAAASISATFALSATLISLTLGVTVGSLIALAPERISHVALRIVDTLLAFPSVLLALAWAAISGPGWSTLIVALTLGTFPPFSRLVYARTRELLREEYIHAAFAAGASRTRVLFKHLIPALASLCAIKIPGLFAAALLSEATLSYLGIGVPIGRDSWGSLLIQGQQYLIEFPHISFGVGIPLFFTILSLQLVGERLSKTAPRA